jgi:small redox-active disulfide protein 2
MAEHPLRIEVLGPGCARCVKAHQVVEQVVRESGLDVEVVKEESFDRMLELGVVATPAVVVDGVVKLAGKVPEPAAIRELLGVAG